MKRTFVLGITAFVALAVATPARAVVISFVPSSTTVDIGDFVNIDVQVSELGNEIVSGYDLDVDFDSSIVTAIGVTFSTFLGGPADAFEEFANPSPGVIDFLSVSAITDDNELFALQMGGPVLLATLSFQALAAGTTSLIFDPDDFLGIVITGRDAGALEVAADTGEIIVREPTQTPEPSTLWLGLVGLLAARELRRRRAR
jgi:MYXO-CTERM domain-containing protein